MQVWELALDGDLLMHSICILVEKYGKRPAFKIRLKIQGRIAKIDPVGGSCLQMCKKKFEGKPVLSGTRVIHQKKTGNFSHQLYQIIPQLSDPKVF